MSQFTTQMLGHVQRCRTEAEVSWVLSDGTFQLVATIWESAGGWKTEIYSEKLIGEHERDFDAALEDAKERLRHYVNRTGENPPEGLTAAGLSFWLLEKDDGTAMGVAIQR